MSKIYILNARTLQTGSKVNVENENECEVVDFSVIDMAGNVRAYKSTSIKDLRLQVAVQHGVLHPCIVLFTQLDAVLVEDSCDLTQTFCGAAQPYVLTVINNEESVKQDAAHWSAEQWIHVIEPQMSYGDESTIAHVNRLMDNQVEEKMRGWVKTVIADVEENEFYGARESLHTLSEYAERIKSAIALGANIVNVRGGRSARTLLHQAAELGHMDLLHALIHAPGVGLRVNAVAENGCTPLLEATRCGHVEAVRALLNADADPLLGETLIDGSTSLHYASGRRGSSHAVTLLLEADVDVNTRNGLGRSPLFWAAQYGHVDAVRLLIDAGAGVNVSDHKGHTPLHEASIVGHAHVIELLVQAGANAKARNKKRETPYDVARNDESKKALLGQ